MRGHELLETLKTEARAGQPVAAMLRHAARHAITDPHQPHLAELTDEGRAQAEEFGVALRGFARVRLFHSPVVRCRDTAECIARGARRVEVEVELAGGRPELGIDYIRDLAEAARLTALHRDHFVRLWFEGAVPASVIDPIPELARLKLGFVRDGLAELEGRSGVLDLHVSHDWNILALREHCCGVRHEEAGWLDFLDGIAFQTAPRGLRAIYRQTACEVGG